MKNLEKMTFDEVITEYEDFHHGTVKDEVREFLYIAHSEIVEAYKNGKEESYFRSLCQQMDSEQKKELLKIWSGWDRKTKTSVLNNRYSDMGT